jgi:hypothetical protein
MTINTGRVYWCCIILTITLINVNIMFYQNLNNVCNIFFSGEFLGLYGNNDGIKDNDLVSRNGVLINSNDTMIDIHNQFGLTCNYVHIYNIIVTI